MFEIQLILSPIIVLLSLSTSFGVFVHETKVDKLATLAIMSPAAATQKVSAYGMALLEGMPHTHIESGLVKQSNELSAKNPSLTPRRDKDEKYRLQKKVSRGTHLFDSYYLPIDLIRGV